MNFTVPKVGLGYICYVSLLDIYVGPYTEFTEFDKVAYAFYAYIFQLFLFLKVFDVALTLALKGPEL